MRLTILTRASDLARIQGHIVKHHLQTVWPSADVVLAIRDSAGDANPQTPLWQLGDKGAFTADLSDALARGDADSPTRLRHLVEGKGDALVVAKAALDRLLHPESPLTEAAQAVRDTMDQCHWMVLPIREHPPAAAQGALALEVAASNRSLAESLQRVNDAATWRAVNREREILAGYGGGCHQAIGASVLTLPFGDLTSALATYAAESPLPGDLNERTHFFWRSSSEFRKAIAICPEVRDRWHACGPGHTLEVVERLAGPRLVRPCLSYSEWLNEITA